MFRQADLSQFFLGNSGPLKRQNEQRTQYVRDYEKSKRSRQFLKEWKQNRPFRQPDILNEHVKLKIKVGKVYYKIL
jgi:hypothetical protein